MDEEKRDKEEEGLFLYLEPQDLSEEERTPKPKITLIPFSLADEWYALDIDNLRGVLNIPAITLVPGLPDFIRGVINIKGEIISLTDLKRLFALAETPPASVNRIIVIHAAKKTTGLLVDSIGKALSVPLDSLQPALSTLPQINKEYIRGEIKLPDERLITILDIGKIMSLPQMLFE